jgi:hypothetical protein
MRGYHSKTRFTVVEEKELNLFLRHKKRYIFPVKMIVRGVPVAGKPPFLLTLVKPVISDAEIMILNESFDIVEVSQELLPILDKLVNQDMTVKAATVIENFLQLKDAMIEEPPVATKVRVED